LEPSFPEHLRKFGAALETGDEEQAIEVTREYYHRVDAAVMRTLKLILSQRSASVASASASAGNSGNGQAPAPDRPK
jgi:hypothetical protein